MAPTAGLGFRVLIWAPIGNDRRFGLRGGSLIGLIRVVVKICQNYGPFLSTINTRCCIIIGIQNGTIF